MDQTDRIKILKTETVSLDYDGQEKKLEGAMEQTDMIKTYKTESLDHGCQETEGAMEQTDMITIYKTEPESLDHGGQMVSYCLCPWLKTAKN